MSRWSGKCEASSVYHQAALQWWIFFSENLGCTCPLDFSWDLMGFHEPYDI